MNKLTASIIQSCSGLHHKDNVIIISAMVRQAIADGAQLVSMPEAVNTMSQGFDIKHYEQRYDPFVTGMQKIAREAGVWLHLGSVIIQEKEKLYNRSLLINANGELQQSYNKIHMFDIELEGKIIKESDSYTAGDEVVIAECPWGKTGLSICYDLRFPAMYRQQAQAGCRLLMIPAAFTHITGKDHWHILLRARAIENSSWVIAANQCGHHEDGRHSYGHSLIVDPWGRIVAEGSEESGIITATIDLSQADYIRKQIPAWNLE